MKKTFYVLGMAALMAGFTACNSGAETTDNNESAAVENADEGAKCGEGKCGEGKCGAATSEKKKSKLDMMDTDADGQISQEEFITLMSTKFTVKDADGSGSISKDECIQDGCASFDNFNILDTDGDSFISEQEYTDGLGNVFSNIDADADGFISKEELKVHAKGEKTTTEGEKQDHFASIDTDGNGEISKEEFEAHITVEFTEKDKNADGQITADECGKFDMLNKDGDDFISDEEFTNGHNMMFEKMDKDGSGTISKEEMEAQIKAMKAEVSEDADTDAKCGEGKCGK